MSQLLAAIRQHAFPRLGSIGHRPWGEFKHRGWLRTVLASCLQCHKELEPTLSSGNWAEHSETGVWATEAPGNDKARHWVEGVAQRGAWEQPRDAPESLPRAGLGVRKSRGPADAACCGGECRAGCRRCCRTHRRWSSETTMVDKPHWTL